MVQLQKWSQVSKLFLLCTQEPPWVVGSKFSVFVDNSFLHIDYEAYLQINHFVII